MLLVQFLHVSANVSFFDGFFLHALLGPNSKFLFAVNSFRTVESATDLSRLRTERSWYGDGSGEP